MKMHAHFNFSVWHMENYLGWQVSEWLYETASSTLSCQENIEGPVFHNIRDNFYKLVPTSQKKTQKHNIVGLFVFSWNLICKQKYNKEETVSFSSYRVIIDIMKRKIHNSIRVLKESTLQCKELLKKVWISLLKKGPKFATQDLMNYWRGRKTLRSRGNYFGS